MSDEQGAARIACLDDQRALAALSLLGELASRTQIVFFTHHRHLVDLAAESVAKEALMRHDLDALTARHTARRPVAES